MLSTRQRKYWATKQWVPRTRRAALKGIPRTPQNGFPEAVSKRLAEWYYRNIGRKLDKKYRVEVAVKQRLTSTIEIDAETESQAAEKAAEYVTQHADSIEWFMTAPDVSSVEVQDVNE